MTNDTTIKRHKNGTVECTVTFSDEQKKRAEDIAAQKMAQNVKIDGFRVGHVPADMAKAKLDPEALLEETVRELLPETFDRLVKENDIEPVISPRVEAESKEPLVLKVIFVERPEVTLKGVDKIKVEKKEPKVDEKDIQKMIDYVLQQHEVMTEVDREAKEGDKITMDFYGEDENGKEIDNTRSKDYQAVIGGKTLIPGFEDALIGMKKGESKSFEVTFPENYQAEELQNKKATFHATANKIEEVSKPELTDEFAKKELNAESVDQFKADIEKSMLAQEEDIEKKRREGELLDKIRECTTVDIPLELVDDETRIMLDEFSKQLEQQNMTVEQWLGATQKKPEEFLQELKQNAEKRIALRLGMQKLVDEKSIDVSDEEMKEAIDQMLAPVPADQRAEMAAAYAPGQQAYEQFKWQKKVEKMIVDMLK